MTARAQEWARDEHQPECNGFPWQQNLPPFLPIISRSRLSAYYTLFGKFADTPFFLSSVSKSSEAFTHKGAFLSYIRNRVV